MAFGNKPVYTMNALRSPLQLAALLIAVVLIPAIYAQDGKPDVATMKIFRDARALQENDKPREAETLLTEALAAGNDHILLHMALATNRMAQKDYDGAAESYREVWKRDGSHQALEGLAVCLLHEEKVDELRGLVDDLLNQFGKLKEGRVGVLFVAGADGNQALFNEAITRIPLADIKKDTKLATTIALASKMVAQKSLKAEKQAQNRIAADQTVVPYHEVSAPMGVVESAKIDGIACVPFYLKSAKLDVTIDSKRARFRIRTSDGKETPLEIELLSSIPKEKLTDFEKSRLVEGFTHRIWIPSDKEKYNASELIWDLPNRSLNLAAGIEKPFWIPLGPKK